MGIAPELPVFAVNIADEMEANKKQESSTLLMMLTYLDKKFEFLDSLLERKHGLSRMSLAKIRKGGELPYAHEHYFKVLLGMIESLRMKHYEAKDAEQHREVKDFMFKVMKRELLGLEKLVV